MVQKKKTCLWHGRCLRASGFCIELQPTKAICRSSSSDSDSDSDEIFVKDNANNVDSLADDEDEAGPSVPAQSYFRTKNEAVEDDVTIPEIEAVGPDEHLEKVGEILNIIDSVVIVKGLPSDDPRRGSDRALDSETLLVFDDRKVLGYVSSYLII